MKTVILCGGIGTRIREETEFKPKPMVNIGNRPILWHIMKIYAHFGYKDFILCLGYKGEIIRDYFYHYEVMNSDVTIDLGPPKRVFVHQPHQEKDWQITFVNTGEKTLKGGRIKKIEQYIPDTDTDFMVTYGDGLADIDINALLEFHRGHGKLATVTGVLSISRFGELKIQGDRVESFTEKPNSVSEFVNGGFFVFNRKIFNYLSADDNCDLEFGVLEKISREGQLMVYKHKGFWACMDTLRDMDYLNELWQKNRPWAVWTKKV